MSEPAGESVVSWVGLEVVASDGTRVGRCSETYHDARTGRPEWLLLAAYTGVHHVIPVSGAEAEDDSVHVAYPEALILASPAFGAAQVLSEADEQRLHEHFGAPQLTSAGPLARVSSALGGLRRASRTNGSHGSTHLATDDAAPDTAQITGGTFAAGESGIDNGNPSALSPRLPSWAAVAVAVAVSAVAYVLLRRSRSSRSGSLSQRIEALSPLR